MWLTTVGCTTHIKNREECKNASFLVKYICVGTIFYYGAVWGQLFKIKWEPIGTLVLQTRRDAGPLRKGGGRSTLHPPYWNPAHGPDVMIIIIIVLIHVNDR